MSGVSRRQSERVRDFSTRRAQPIRAARATAARRRGARGRCDTTRTRPIRPSPRAETHRHADEPVCAQGPDRARREEDRVRAGRGFAVGSGQRCFRAQSAGQDSSARAGRRHAALRFARDRRVPRRDEPGQPAHPRAVAATHRRQALGGAGRRHLRRCGADFLERKRPVRQQSKDWIARQRTKIDLGVVELAEELGERGWCNGEGYSLADIATGCTLGYLDLRFPEIDWRARTRPRRARREACRAS